ncbi:MAG: hypothetical protein QHC79_09680 [Pseudosphingobacterium sp.]|nr:hypothetical protein [Pseudosphingobacterium sp.]
MEIWILTKQFFGWDTNAGFECAFKELPTAKQLKPFTQLECLKPRDIKVLIDKKEWVGHHVTFKLTKKPLL